MKLSIKLVEMEKEYIANCPELDVNCYGSNREEAIRRLKNVLQFYFDSAQEFGLDVESFESISVDGDMNHTLVSSDNISPSKAIN